MIVNTVETLSENIGRLVQDLTLKRDTILEDFLKAYVCSLNRTTGVDLDSLVQSIELVEKWSGDRTTVSWYFRAREK